MMSRYGESRMVSGTGRSRSAHSRCNASVSASEVRTVSAVSVLGLVARAKASARSVGVCSLETSTTPWIRLGSVIGSSVGSSSAATRS